MARGFEYSNLNLLAQNHTLVHTHNNGVKRRERMCVCTLSAVSSPDRPVEQVSALSSAASWSDEKFASLTSHTPGDAVRGRGLPAIGFVCFIVLFEKK